MTEKEKETIIDALEMGIALTRIYCDKVGYLYEQYLEEGNDEKKDEYYIKAIEARRKIGTLEKLKDQYK